MNNREEFNKIRKPLAPPSKVFASKKDYARNYCIEDYEEEWLDNEETSFSKLVKITIDK